MYKIFFCHSNEDKKDYVDEVAKHFDPGILAYDVYAFEEGMLNEGEIIKNLEKTVLFVVFLSANSLESDTVIEECNLAKDLMANGIIKSIFPIIIDKKITEKDFRIPEWLRDYNLRLINKPRVAANRILRQYHRIRSKEQPRNRLFIGRNELIQKFEERLYRWDLHQPKCVIAAGMPNVGRKAFLEHCFHKTDIFEEGYQPFSCALDVRDSIEDFILRLADFGYIDQLTEGANIMDMTMQEKIHLAAIALGNMQNDKEILFIEDTGCLVTPERRIRDWFQSIVESSLLKNKVTIAIIANYRPLESFILEKKGILPLEVPELSLGERNGLFSIYASQQGLVLKQNQFESFTRLLNGFPNQIIFAVDLIKSDGIFEASKETNLIRIREYNDDLTRNMIKMYQDDKEATDFLVLLSQFTFISYQFIKEIVGDDKQYFGFTDDFVKRGLCEHLGSNKEYIRVNDAVREMIIRLKMTPPSRYMAEIKIHLEHFFNKSRNDNDLADISDIIYSVQELMRQNREVPPEFLFPSFQVKTMFDLYYKDRKYEDVIKLANRLQENEIDLDPYLVKESQMLKCLALARLRDEAFKEEVQKIQGADHDYLFGLYYRLTNNFSKSIDRLNKVLTQNPNSARAKRELVQVYLYLGKHNEALEMAKSNFNAARSQYHMQAYAYSMLLSKGRSEHMQEIEGLIKMIEDIESPRSLEAGTVLKALKKSVIDNDPISAIEIIEDNRGRYGNSTYPYIAEFYICEKDNNIKRMKEIYNRLSKENSQSSYFASAIKVMGIKLKIAEGKFVEAANEIRSLTNYPQNIRDEMMRKITKSS